MKQRIVTGAFIGLLMIAIFLTSHTIVYPIIMGALCVVGTWEMLGCVGHRKNPYLSLPALVLSVVSPIIAYFLNYGAVLCLVLFYITLLLALSVFFDKEVTVSAVGEVFLTTLYVVLCFTALLRLRYVPEMGKYIYLLAFIAAWITDTFAYFTGVFFGKHKLIPKISPKKTVEGSVGGIIFCIIAFAVYGVVVGAVADVKMNLLVLAVVGLVMSVISQIGDLVASSIKRAYGIKDYGTLFPGHGGILDRFDSIMILAPFLLLVAENVKLFNT